MAHWLIGNDRWYVCSVCRYTYDNKIEHVSDRATCPNCHAPMESVRRVYRWSSDLSGGIVIATSMDDALNKLEKKYADVREKIRDFAIWLWEDDDYYDEANPDVFDIYE